MHYAFRVNSELYLQQREKTPLVNIVWQTIHPQFPPGAPSSPGCAMLLSSCRHESTVSVRISSCSRRCPSRVRCQKHDFLFSSLRSWLQVLRKLLLKHRLCRMVFFQPSGAVWKKGKCSLETDREDYEEPGGAQTPPPPTQDMVRHIRILQLHHKRRHTGSLKGSFPTASSNMSDWVPSNW